MLKDALVEAFIKAVMLLHNFVSNSVGVPLRPIMADALIGIEVANDGNQSTVEC